MAMAEDSDLEKTEEPTGRRIEQAREQGQVPHSRELSTFLVLDVAGRAFWMMGGLVHGALHGHCQQRVCIVESQYMREPDLMLPRLAEIVSDALLAFSPLLGLLLAAAVLPPFFLNAWVFSPKALVPD
jgi:flagellar biosynthetic protein FlhB